MKRKFSQNNVKVGDTIKYQGVLGQQTGKVLNVLKSCVHVLKPDSFSTVLYIQYPKILEVTRCEDQAS